MAQRGFFEGPGERDQLVNPADMSIQTKIKTTPKRGGLLLGYNPWIAGTRLKAPALTGFGPHAD